AAAKQRSIEWCEYDVSHAAAHLPEQCAAIAKKEPQRSAQGGACCYRGTVRVASFIGQRDIVENACERGIYGALGGAVQPEPHPVVKMIDCIEAARISEQAEPDGTDKISQHEIDDLPLISYVIVRRHDLFELLSNRGGDSFY